jgi:hypothetical protein
MAETDKKKTDLSEIRFVKAVSVGSVNPNVMLVDGDKEQQTAMLNRCLNDYPKGVIIGKDIAIGRYAIGEHELSMQKTTYLVGFARKPAWLEEKGQNAK